MFKKITTFLNKNSVLRSWIISYAIVLALMVFINMIVFFQVGNMVTGISKQANIAILKQVQQILDTRLSETKKLYSQINWNRYLSSLKFKDKETLEFSWYTVNELSRDFLTYTASNEFIDNFYLYFKNMDLIMMPTGSSYRTLTYETLHTSDNFSYNNWKELMEKPLIDQFLILPIVSKDNEQKRESIAYVRSNQEMNKSYATTVIMMDKSKFLQAIQNIEWVKNGIIFILDDKNNLIATTKSTVLPQALHYENLPANSFEENLLNVHMNNEEMIAAYIPSKVAKWKYVAAFPREVFHEKVRDIRNVSYFSMLAIILLGGTAAFIFSLRNYNPIKQLLQMIERPPNTSTQKKENEYTIIQKTITHMFDEKQKMNQQLEKQNNLLSSHFISRMLKGKVDHQISIEETLERLNIHFDTEIFAVLVIYIEDCSDLFKEFNKRSEEDELEFAQLIIKNVFEEIFGNSHQVIVTETDDMLCCLVNLQHTNSSSNDELVTLSQNAQNFIESNFNLKFTVSISNIHPGYDNISTAFDEALETLEYKVVMGVGNIISHQNITAKTNVYNYYSLETEKQFINCIKIGDFDESKIILQNILEQSVNNTSISPSIAKCLMFNLVSTMMKAMDEVSILCGDSFIEELNPVNRLLECKSINEMQIEITEILHKISYYIKQHKKSHNVELKDKIIDYIKNNYHDVNICISSLADHFEMNPTYMSRFFKEQTGDSILNYINTIRIENAKKYLEETDSNIGDIAVKVGFNNSNALILAFKKSEGITPGKYKKNTNFYSQQH